MSLRVPCVGKEPSPWIMDMNDGSEGVEIKLTPENESTKDPMHVAQARILAEKTLELLGVSSDIRDSASLIISEFGANTIEHGDGLSEVSVKWQSDGAGKEEVLDITVVNVVDMPMEDKIVGGEEIMEGLDIDLYSENGRGMMLAHALTDGRVERQWRANECSTRAELRSGIGAAGVDAFAFEMSN